MHRFNVAPGCAISVFCASRAKSGRAPLARSTEVHPAIRADWYLVTPTTGKHLATGSLNAQEKLRADALHFTTSSRASNLRCVPTRSILPPTMTCRRCLISLPGDKVPSRGSPGVRACMPTRPFLRDSLLLDSSLVAARDSLNTCRTRA